MKHLYLLLLLASSINQVVAQSAKDFFNNPDASTVFVGIDFSKAKMIGSEGFSNPKKIVNYYFDVWNGLMVSERDKYDIDKAFFKKNVTYDVGIVTDFNDNLSHEDLVSNKNYKAFEEVTLQNMIKKYDLSDNEEKYGISFIVHSFNKLEQRAKIYIVLFDTKTKKILFHKKMASDAQGFGFRNYWAGAIHKMLKQTRKDYRKWRKTVID